ncbi:MAG: holo-ACP synthase [Parcubacteria group bacterium]|nr:holo-ACP synthase [Parcubacteria group bacterium]
MRIKTGCDLVEIPSFKRMIGQNGQIFLQKIFTPAELTQPSKIETLAGIFAAKEAVIKAIGFKAGDWHKIEITKEPSGKPKLNLVEIIADNIISYDLSISHDVDYTIATVVFLIND